MSANQSSVTCSCQVFCQPVCISSDKFINRISFDISLCASHIIGDGQSYSGTGTDGSVPCHRSHKSASAAGVCGGIHEPLTTTKSNHRKVYQKVERVVVQHTCSSSGGGEGERRQEDKMRSVYIYPM